jgi:hypothetical protein
MMHDAKSSCKNNNLHRKGVIPSCKKNEIQVVSLPTAKATPDDPSGMGQVDANNQAAV